MSAPGTISAAEQQRLDECAREPIRTPGSIQSHGVLLGLDPESLTVTLVSENCAQAFQTGPDEVIGSRLEDLIGATGAGLVRDIAEGAPNAANPVAVRLRGGEWDVIVHSSGELILVEFETSLLTSQSPSASLVFEAIRRLSLLTTIAELRVESVRTLSQLTGFDRVMLYDFYADGHGEVTAEASAPGLEPYLGLHFPASDIPAQARALYLSKLSRSIVNTERQPSALRIASDDTVSQSIDLSAAELRSVSPYHLQFMRNMGQASTLSFSLVRDGELIGMITCAHRSERRLPYLLRSTLEVLANQLALQFASINEIARLKSASRVRELRTVVVRQIAEAENPGDELFVGAVNIFEVVPADGALFVLGGTLRSFGEVPPQSHFEAWLSAQAATEVVATHSLRGEFAALAESSPGIAGMLVVPLGSDDYLALFRSEVIRTVNWLGDQTAGNRMDPLSPRLSFSSWTESVRGTAAPWGAAEHEARELGRELYAALQRKSTESDLTAAALSDALTGLPNRRSLQERLTHELLERPKGSTALLFIDLDRFKVVNDSHGHDVGDALLVHVAERLARAARDSDTVARLGGDEFVLVCGDTTREQAELVAGRVLEALHKPLIIGGHTLTISASIGIAVALPGHTAADLIKLADISMYKAKGLGGDRAA